MNPLETHCDSFSGIRGSRVAQFLSNIIIVIVVIVVVVTMQTKIRAMRGKINYAREYAACPVEQEAFKRLERYEKIF